MKPITQKAKENKLNELEETLRKTVMAIYDLTVGGRRLIPKYPYVLVRVLPKETKTDSGLYLPGNVQNKPIYEGIVLTTWKSWTEQKFIKDADGNDKVAYVDYTSDLKSGDRVFFPHYEGVALLGYLDDKYYRLVREIMDQDNLPHCGVLGIANFDGDAKLAAELSKTASKFFSRTMSGTRDPNAPHWEPPPQASYFSS